VTVNDFDEKQSRLERTPTVNVDDAPTGLRTTCDTDTTYQFLSESGDEQMRRFFNVQGALHL